MHSDIRPIPFGILCRDFGFLPLESIGFKRIEVMIEHAYQRKGNLNYARALVEHLERWQPLWFDEFFIVGDGEGDVRFFVNLDSLLRDGQVEKRLHGFFIRYQALERFQGEHENMAFYASWGELAAALEKALLSTDISSKAGKARKLVLVDVDRTILFPRFICDDGYLQTRKKGMVDYVLKFWIAERHNGLASVISHYIDFVTRNSEEYTNELNDLCFKNEEVVAIVTLLLCIGTITERWVGPLGRMSLLAMLGHSIRTLEQGNWVSALELENEGVRTAAQGESVWNSEELIGHLKAVLRNLRVNWPVLCPDFRGSESIHLTDYINKRVEEAFNRPLLKALRRGAPSAVVFVSDRPAQSLGFRPNALDEELGGAAFWINLRKYLEQDVVSNSPEQT